MWSASALALLGLMACEGSNHHGHGDSGTPVGSAPEPAPKPAPQGDPGDVPCEGLLRIELTWIDDGLVPTDTDGDGLPDSGCGDVLAVEICDPAEVRMWDFGIVQASGTLDEDCLSSPERCHGLDRLGVMEVAQVADCDPALAASGHTVFDASLDPGLTYYFDDGEVCFVFGADPAYYASLGCAVMVGP